MSTVRNGLNDGGKEDGIDNYYNTKIDRFTNTNRDRSIWFKTILR